MLDRLTDTKSDGADTAESPGRKKSGLELELRGIVHDMRNHIQGIVLALRAATRLAVDSPVEKHLSLALQAARQGSHYLEDMLSLVQPKGMPAGPVELNQLLTEMEPMIGHVLGDAVRLSLATSPKPLWVELQRNGLQAIVTNLATNARDAMSGRGEFAISLTELRETSTRFARITFTDTGCGIEPEVLSRIFDPFYTVGKDGQGTGLGLWMTRRRVEQAGGSIHITSKLKHGSCVTILLPLSGAQG